ncbi:hypothetical protein OG473_39020 [Streptomyces anulatus]|uniref:hypothetical protein n=1 Tax=Streptomyces anulatus TaxID=1892 RepID=UPI0032532BE7
MREVENPDPVIKFPQKLVREFQQLLNQLHEQGLTWLTITDVINNLGAVATWSMEQQQFVETYHVDSDTWSVGPASDSFTASWDLLRLCAEAGWAQPLADGGRDHTTPAALAVHQAKERLAAAMLADSTQQRASANTIAERASKAQSRPTTLKILATELLQRDTTIALETLLEAVPIRVGKWGERTVVLRNDWEPGEPSRENRLDRLEGVQRALRAARLQLHDVQTGEIADIHRLAADDVDPLEVRRIS